VTDGPYAAAMEFGEILVGQRAAGVRTAPEDRAAGDRGAKSLAEVAAHQDGMDRVDWVAAGPFWAVHVAAVVGVALLGWSWNGVLLAVALYYVRMFAITGGYHRYFAHKTYKTSRVMQLLLAFLAQSSTQKGALWWAAHHRLHHKNSDKPNDIHSMKQNGFFWSHIGWFLCHRHDATEWDQIKDFAKYPELRWLNRYHVVPSVVLGAGLYLTLGWWGLVWGYFVSTSVLWHGTFTINSISHWMGRRRYATTDESKNSLVLALITMGEGWHNNHHYYPRATNQGFYWWEIDVTYYVLRAMSAVGLVWDIHTPPAKIRDRRIGARRSADTTPAPEPIEAVVEQPAA